MGTLDLASVVFELEAHFRDCLGFLDGLAFGTRSHGPADFSLNARYSIYTHIRRFSFSPKFCRIPC